LLFIPNLFDYNLFDYIEADKNIYEAHCILGFSASDEKPKLIIDDLSILKNGKIDAYTLKEFEALVLYPFDENSKDCAFLYGNYDVDSFFGVLIEWREKENEKDISLHDTFFSSMVSLARTTIISYIAETTKKRLDDFSEESRHDIAGKRAILLMHHKSFDWDIEEFERVISSIPSEYRNRILAFYQQAKIYHKQMKVAYDALGFLQRTLDTDKLKDIAERESFSPQERFLWNFKQQFNNPNYKYSYGKKLHIVNMNTNTPPNMYSDPVMIERILQNILENSYKYAYDGTNVFLIYSFEEMIEGQYNHVFKIRNFGNGISKEVSKKLFILGFQGEHGNDGKGQGLSIARKYASLHGGSIELTKGIISEDDELSPL
jgi:signal transduction histidine kinase